MFSKMSYFLSLHYLFVFLSICLSITLPLFLSLSVPLPPLSLQPVVRSQPSWSRPSCPWLTMRPAPVAAGGAALCRTPWCALEAAATLGATWGLLVLNAYTEQYVCNCNIIVIVTVWVFSWCFCPKIRQSKGCHGHCSYTEINPCSTCTNQ